MKTVLGLVLLASLSSSFAAEATPTKIKIKEIKNHLKITNPDTTCMDEYVKRRRQLITKLAVSPVVAVAGTMASTYAGGVVAGGIATASGVEGWTGLGYVIGGAVIGGATGAVAVTANATVTAVTLNNINLILKSVGEQRLDREGPYTDKLYKKYLKKSKKDISKEDFIARLIEADGNGSLCDGSMVKQPKVRLGTKLKYKVAKLKDLTRHMDK